MSSKKLIFALFCCTLMFASVGHAENVGVVKTLMGNVQLMRGGEFVPVGLGDKVFIADKLKTESNSSVGILFQDNTRIGAGPNTDFSIDGYRFDSKTKNGQADLSIENGTLALVGGNLTTKRLDAVKVHTPTSTLTASCSTLSVKVDPFLKEVP